MDGQLQERWVRERRALGSELCACSAPEGAPQAEGGRRIRAGELGIAPLVWVARG